MGRIGFQPRRSVMRISDWSLTGALMDPTNDGGDALRRLQARHQHGDRQRRRVPDQEAATRWLVGVRSGTLPERPDSTVHVHAAEERSRRLASRCATCTRLPRGGTAARDLRPRLPDDGFRGDEGPGTETARRRTTRAAARVAGGRLELPLGPRHGELARAQGAGSTSRTRSTLRSDCAQGEFAGFEVPDRAWKRLLRDVLGNLARVEKVTAPQIEGRSSTGKQEIAGFGYRPGDAATGSMTTAGIAVVELCRQGLGKKLGSSEKRKIDRSRKLALDWLAYHFSVVENPGKAAWIYYYLYGLERVGSLLGLDHIGSHAWYYEGAERLVKVQRDDGAWAERNEEADTCFALLFPAARDLAWYGPQRRSAERPVAVGRSRPGGSLPCFGHRQVDRVVDRHLRRGS